MTDHTRTEKIGGDSIFMFVVTRVEQETIMTFIFEFHSINSIYFYWTINIKAFLKD